MLGEHEAQLRHPASQTGSLLHEIDLQSRIRQVERGAHAANPTTDHKGSRGSRTIHPASLHLHTIFSTSSPVMEPFPLPG
jgi:hypothetical protein